MPILWLVVALFGATPHPPAIDCWIQGNRVNLATRASPHDSTSVVLGRDTVTVCYARPAKRGRAIMGSLVPYGEPWRLGANEATAIHVPFPAMIAGVAVDSGWYSLYVVPSQHEWRIVVNAEPRRWGIPIDDSVRARDVGSGVVPVARMQDTVENLTITLRRTSPVAAVIDITWENTHIAVPIARRT